MQALQADAVPVCIATHMADVISIATGHLRATPARSVSSGAMDSVARMSTTIRLSPRGQMLRADALLGRGCVNAFAVACTDLDGIIVRIALPRDIVTLWNRMKFL
jgi:hypothetical protein